MISVPFELEYVELGVLIPGIPLPEKSQKECSLSFSILTDPFSNVSGLCLHLLGLQLISATATTSSNTMFLQWSSAKFREKLIL